MAVARRAETYIRAGRAHLVSSISRGALTRRERNEDGARLEERGTSRRSRWRRAGQRTRIYETVIFRKLRAGNSWPCRRFMAAVCPACAINPSLSPRIELPPILRRFPLPPPAASLLPPGPVASPLPNPVVVHAISCTYERATTGTNQFFSSPRTYADSGWLLAPSLLHFFSSCTRRAEN